MASVVKTIDINVPVQTAYNQWTQFESFPLFMEDIEEVKQIDDFHLRWRANISGTVKEWDAVITEQIPDDRIAWTQTEGPRNAGVVTFHRLSDDSCRVTLQMEYEPEGAIESVADALGVVSRRVEADLECFKEFIERQGTESGAWRGSVEKPATAHDAPGVSSTAQTGTGEYSNRGVTDETDRVGAGQGAGEPLAGLNRPDQR